MRVRFVRADLDEAHAGALHDVGHPKRAPDLDELAARDDHLAAGRQAVERQHHGTGVVVDRVGGGRVRQQGQLLGRRAQAIAPLARRQIELQIAVAEGRLQRGPRRPLGKRSAPEIRMEHDARGVDHAARAHARQIAGQPGGFADQFRCGLPLRGITKPLPLGGQGGTAALGSGPERNLGELSPEGSDQSIHAGELSAGVGLDHGLSIHDSLSQIFVRIRQRVDPPGAMLRRGYTTNGQKHNKRPGKKGQSSATERAAAPVIGSSRIPAARKGQRARNFERSRAGRAGGCAELGGRGNPGGTKRGREQHPSRTAPTPEHPVRVNVFEKNSGALVRVPVQLERFLAPVRK